MSTDSDPMDVIDLRKRAELMEKEIYKERISALVSVYGSIRRVGRALKIDHAYLSRLHNGEKSNPSVTVLIKLGLG